jgi:UDP-N-acetylmuramoyl-L-alanyl-D-glutamate--2,6-diaminopimelate ligase
MILRELVQQVGAVSVEGPLEQEIAGLAYDSRRITPGMVFVAIPGLTVDGHDYIPSAIERGAAAVICERNGFVSQRAARIKVRNARAALARAAAAYYQQPSTRLKVIGVTGTSGKTTVAFMLQAMLKAAGLQAGLISTVHYEVGDRLIPAQRSTPEALEIQQMLAAMVRTGCSAAVMEVSSHALAQSRVAGVQFDAAVFTNLSEDHLDYHPDMEAYYQCKRTLFEALAAGAKRSGAVINIDDRYGARLLRDTRAEVQLTYGLGDAACVRASRLQLGRQGTRMVIDGPGAAFECRLPLIGRHNIYNALAAVGAALVLKLPAPAIQTALNTMSPAPGRLESISHGQPFGVFVDYAHTAEALRQALVTLREVTTGRLLLVFGCGGSRDTGKRPAMGRVAAELADFTFITSDNPRKESPAQIAAQIEAGYHAVRPEAYRVELDRRRAIDAAIRHAQPGDVVLIAGKGHETYQEFADTIVPFDDRLYARATLDTIGYARRPGNGQA